MVDSPPLKHGPLLRPSEMIGRPTNDLKRLTTAERIWLWRRRQQSTNGRAKGRGGSRLSLGEAAAMLGLTSSIYAASEEGDNSAEMIVVEAIETLGGALKFRPSTAELCALARRRSAEPVDDLCRALGGISRPTYFARELAGDTELVDLWRARGYNF